VHRTGWPSSCRCKPLRWLVLDKASRRQVASADWHDASREEGLRALGKACDRIRRENAAARRKATPYAMLALRPRRQWKLRRGPRFGGSLRRAALNDVSESWLPDSRVRTGATPRSSDLSVRAEPVLGRVGTAKTWKSGQNRHAHTTRQCHWTWRFVSIPWVRRSFGRKRRSGRRSRRSLLQRDHVKVVGRGARPPAVPAGLPARRASARRKGSVTVPQAQHTSVR
jgi:hypothetical protein